LIIFKVTSIEGDIQIREGFAIVIAIEISNGYRSPSSYINEKIAGNIINNPTNTRRSPIT